MEGSLNNSSQYTVFVHDKVTITVQPPPSEQVSNFNDKAISISNEAPMNLQQKKVSMRKDLLQLPQASYLNVDETIENHSDMNRPLVRERRCNSMSELTNLTKRNRRENFFSAPIYRGRSSSYHGESLFEITSATNLVDGLLTTDLCSTEL